jgi:hypothetical protein
MAAPLRLLAGLLLFYGAESTPEAQRALARQPVDAAAAAAAAAAWSTAGAAAPEAQRALARQPAGDAAAAAEADADADADDAAVDVTKVHLVFSHHLDVGLDLALKATADCVGFATKILQRYFDEFLPRAIKLANEARAVEGPKFVYQVHPWVIAMYMDCVGYTVQDDCPLNPGRLKCPRAAALGEFEAAVHRGDIVWHASPFNIDPGVVADPALFEDIIGMVKDLDARFGLNKTARVWSNVDVRGFVRSAIPRMTASGVDFLSINSNGKPKLCRGSNETGSSLPVCGGPQPAVGGNNATMFRWRDPISQEEVTVLFHDSYAHRFTPTAAGGFVTNRGESLVTPDGIALSSYYRSDNTGPPSSYAEVREVFKAAGSVFPGATVQASSFEAFAAEALTPEVVAALPVYEFEWGDKWVTGMSTDPQRLRVYREVVRARADCIQSGACSRQDPSIRNMTRYLAKISEHTQGEQNEEWNPGYRASGANLDTTHWSNADFAQVHNNHTNIFQFGELSWLEARIFNNLAIAAAPPALKASIDRRLEAIAEKEAVPAPPIAGLTKLVDPSQPVQCGSGASVTFDVATASISQLQLGGQSWSGSLLRYTYVTYADDETWDGRKNVKTLAQAEDRVWSANISALYYSTSSSGGGNGSLPAAEDSAGGSGARSCRLVAVLKTDAEARSKYGAPSSGWLEMSLDPEAGVLEATFQFRGKRATRLAESMVVSFKPSAVPEHHWSMDVLGEWVRPEEVVEGGNYYSHAVNSGVKFASDGSSRKVKFTGLTQTLGEL